MAEGQTRDGPEWSQGDQEGTVAVAQMRQDGGLGCRRGSEGGGNELRQRWPAGHLKPLP